MTTSDTRAFSLMRGCLSLFFLVSVVLTSFGQLKKAPKWVRHIPSSTEVFYGMGSVDMRLYPEYRAKARKIALREIAEKIFVSINSNSILTMTYENEEVDYILDETVSMASSNILNGHHKVDEWIDKRADRYYVLFLLDKAEYKANREAYFASLEELTTLMQKEASELFNQGEVSRGINKLTESIRLLDTEMKRLVEPEYAFSMKNWRLKSIYELEHQIDQIGFALQRRYEFRANAKEPLIIEHFLVNKSTGVPLSGLKLDLRVIQGDIFRYSFVHDHHDALSIYGMFPENQVAIFQVVADLKVEKDMQKLLDPSVRTTFVSQPVSIQFIPYAIAFDWESTESTSENNDVIKFLRKVTNDLGLKEVYNSEADYHITLEPSGMVKSHNNGYYSGSVSMEMSIKDPKTNIEVYEYSFPQTSIRVPNPDLAWSYALDKNVVHSDDFLVSFVTFLCSLQ